MFENDEIDVKKQIVEVRRLQILQGAANVFAQHGYHKATTKQIAKAAGVSEGTIYNYFDNKRELLFAMIDMVATHTLKSTIMANPPDDLREMLTQLLHDRYELLEQHGHLMAPIIAEIFADADLRAELYERVLTPLTHFLEEYFQNLSEQKVIRPLNPILITRAFIGALVINAGIKITNLDPRYQTISNDFLIENLVDLFLNGLLEETTS